MEPELLVDFVSADLVCVAVAFGFGAGLSLVRKEPLIQPALFDMRTWRQPSTSTSVIETSSPTAIVRRTS